MTTPLIMTLAHGGLATFGPMASTAVLGQADSQGNSVATWLGVLGQCVGAIATFAAVIVALWLPRWERRKAAADRRNQQREQQLHNARLVTVSVPRDQPAAECIAIFNGSDQPVFQPRVDSVRDPDVYWDQDPQWSTFDAPWEPTFFPEVLPPKATHYLMYGYFNPDDSEVTGEIEKRIRAEDVTITFMDTSRQQWRRTGSGEPVRVVQQRTP